MTPESIKQFTKVFSTLPSIGPRQATRLAFYLVNLGKGSLAEISNAVNGLKELRRCPNCFFICNVQCPICSDKNRRQDVVAIIEKETDLISLEKTKKYNGIYLVLGELDKSGIFNPEQKMKLNYLKSKGSFAEIILAINPTTYGDLNASLIAQELRSCSKKITRLGRGIPTGGEIEFADEDTLGGALDNRN
ncbi:MAG: toprim domain-containing protein [Patescibacteria group bacterium]